MRYFFEISYKGTNYHGWQIQNNATTIQGVVQDALKQLSGKEVEITGSGRTDTGVHATRQVFHADFDNEIELDDLTYKLNAVLPKDICILSMRKVFEYVHARFDAVSRAYDYVILSERDPFLINEAYVYHHAVNIDKMNKASELLLGKHDFEAFSKVKTQVNNFFCEVAKAHWRKENNKIIFHIEANRFLRGMVRAIVGTLLMINEDKIGIDDLTHILESKDRKKAGRSVSPDGLFLSKISYPENIFE